MARSPAQRGKVGNWLVESRLARGWDTQATAREQIARLTGWKIPQSVYAEWESGRRLPSEANLDRLRAFYGDAPGATETPDSLAAAISTQAAALSALAVEMHELVSELRLARGSALASRIEAIEAFAAQSGYRPRLGDVPGQESLTEDPRPAAVRR